MTKAVISYPRHVLNNIFLLALCAAVSPFIFTISALAYAAGKLWPRKPRTPSTTPRTVLVTCPGRMTKSLTLCRAFYEAGYRVIAAEVTPSHTYEYSKSVSKYYSIPSPTHPDYITTLGNIITKENVDLLVPVCGVHTTIEDVKAAATLEKSTGCRMFQLDLETCKLLDEKDSFIARAQELGLTIPETQKFRSKEGMLKFLESLNPTEGKRYILKCIALDDTSRSRVPLLPLPDFAATRAALETIPVSDKNPFILQQYIEGQEFTTHAVVTHGKVRAFGCCASSELTMHYKPLPSQSGISQAMLEFTRRYVDSLGDGIVGQISFDFIVPAPPAGLEYTDLRRDEVTLYPIECNPRTHTAVVLFQDQLEELGNAYMSVFEDKNSLSDNELVQPGQEVKGRYWIGHDFTAFILFPFLNTLLLKETPYAVVEKFCTFWYHVLYWTDGVLTTWDPLPFLVLYTVHWPRMFLMSLWTGKRWTRVNVSTSRVFDAHLQG